MIVRNEAAILARCLQSARPVADQIVVVDTGSEDDTIAIARSFGAEVVSAIWRNDFAWARNISLDRATCAWILWLDADDVVPPESLPKLLSLKETPPDKVFGFTVRNERQGNTGSEFVQARLFPNLAGIRFEGTIHEQMMPSALLLGLTLEKNNIVIEHHGYADAGMLKSKAQRNIALLLGKYDPSTGDQVTAVEIADSYQLIENWDEARKWYDIVLKVPHCADDTPVIASQAHMGLGSMYNKLNDYENAIPHFKESLRFAEWRTDARYLLAVCWDCTGFPDEAISCLRRILATAASPGQVGVDFRAVRLKAAMRLLRILSEQDRTNEALAEVQSALAAFPGRPEIFLMAGKTLLKQGRLMEALKSFEKSIILAPQKNIDSYIGLCLIYQKAERMETARQSFESIKQLFSSSPRYWAFKHYFLEISSRRPGFPSSSLRKSGG